MPSALKAILIGVPSWLETLKLSTKDAVDTSKPVESVYSLTSSPILPVTNILVPSVLKARPLGAVSWLETLKLSTKLAVETSNPVERVYSLTSWPTRPNTNILVPSVLKARLMGKVSWLKILKLSTKEAPAIVLVPSPSLTVRVPSSRIVPVSFWATGASLEPKTVIVIFAVVMVVPSESV